MEPSLRSSTQRGNECKLRKTDPAAHETTKRFVESLRTDVRISQYADLTYAAKKIEESKEPWYWLEPVPGGRTGFLVFLPGQPAVWMDEQGKVSFFVQMRVSVDIYQKSSVFLASLNKFDGLLRLEDTWLVAGNSQTFPFTQRWEYLVAFYGTQYKEDFQLQQGLRIELASFQSLASIIVWLADSVPDTMFLQGDKYTRRLRVQMNSSPPAPAPAPAPTPLVKAQVRKPLPLMQEKEKQKQKQKQNQPPMFVDDDNEDESLLPENVALAVAHEEYPDTYNLSIKGVKKGYAAVQDLDLSRELRLLAKEGKDLYVNVEWNSEFNMYEILSKHL